MESLKDITHTLYINLEERTDRKEHVEKQMKKLGIPVERFNAVKLANGRVGCSISHLKCLEIAKKNGWEHIMIIEDDIEFTNPTLFKIHLNKFLKNQKNFDVLLIAGNIIPPFQRVEDFCIKVRNCQTTTGYLVKSHYYDTLIDNIKEGIKLLLKNPDNHVLYAVDKYWFQLQERDNWYLITPLTVVQREDYSDIEKKMTNYSKIMTDLEKSWLFKPYEQQVKINQMNQVNQMNQIIQIPSIPPIPPKPKLVREPTNIYDLRPTPQRTPIPEEIITKLQILPTNTNVNTNIIKFEERITFNKQEQKTQKQIIREKIQQQINKQNTIKPNDNNVNLKQMLYL
jgi:glycosyl transferase family 25